ncbi:hypothetical protein L2E76_23290, partial [Planktothrix agardhii 1811]|uniref:hypothetical protein n=1 Tax=Planktothrix agardhii TaxID=1160 RepID=UPI001F272555
KASSLASVAFMLQLSSNTIFLIHLFLPRQLLKEHEAKDHPLQPRQSFSPSPLQSANLDLVLLGN